MAENLCVFTGEAFLLAPRELPQNWAEAGCRDHVAHLLRQVPVRLRTRPWRGEFLGRSGGGDRPPPESLFARDAVAAKQALRRTLARRRDLVPADERRRWSFAAAQHVIDSGSLDGMTLLAVFAPFGSEADPSAIVHWHRDRGGRVCFPRVTPDGLRWHEAAPEALRPVPPWQIREPLPTHRPVDPSVVDAWIVPGLGFTQAGLRLGYGGGYYDRTLPLATGPTIGFTFDLQVLEALPAQAHDRRMTHLATERGLFPCADPEA